MNIKKTLLVAGAVSTVGLTGLGAMGVASAATDTSSGNTNLVDKIASTFNINKDEVQKVFDADRAEHEIEHQQKVEEQLTKLVTDGKITAAQKDAIVAKQAEMKTQMESERDTMKDKTAEERKTIMEQKRTDLEKWASDNGIDKQYLRLVMGGGHGGPGGPGMGSPRPADAGEQTQDTAQ